jgi:UDP-N-acetylmuramyl tripeptide synthase
MGLEVEKICSSLATFEPVDGRVNIFTHNNINYIVDFAHTPAALKSLLEYANINK